MEKDNPHTRALEMLRPTRENSRPRYAWNKATIVVADLERKKLVEKEPETWKR